MEPNKLIILEKSFNHTCNMSPENQIKANRRHQFIMIKDALINTYGASITMELSEFPKSANWPA